MLDRFKAIIDDLSNGTPVLTVNRRLARSLVTRHERAMIEAGESMWESPVVLPLLSWVKNLWVESRQDTPLLSDRRSYALWKKVISRDRRLARPLLFPRGAVRAAYKAYVLTRQYMVRLPAGDTYLTEEAGAFKDWLGQYEKELQRLGFIDTPLLVERVRGLIDEGRLSVPRRIVLAGFDEITPDTKALLASLQEAGCEVMFWPEKPGDLSPALPIETERLEIRGYDDDVLEVRSCARWARASVEAGKKVGIIVPELERYRSLVINEFSAELDPASLFPWEPSAHVFNISLGAPLDAEPLVRSAIDILSLGAGKIPMDTMSSVLRSSYFMADIGEAMAFAAFEKEFRERVCGEISLWGLKRAVDKKNIPSLAGLSERLNIWIAALKEGGKVKNLPGFWVSYFDDFLKGLSWPSDNPALNSREFQALKAWHDLLGEFAALDDVVGRLTWAGAAAELRAMAGETIHQPESALESPVQVLGLLESSGLGFDNVWILGAHEDALPGRCSPNPFIPMDLQKKAGLPRSTPELTLEFARATLGRVLKSAPLAVASFPKVVAGKELKASPLLAGKGLYVEETAPMPGHRPQDSTRASYDVEDMVEGGNVPLGDEELKSLRGGTSIIKDQSACPFRAFAIYRLGARVRGEAELGLDHMDRGTVAHEAMKFFWEEVKDSERLALAHKEGRLALLIKEAVAKALLGSVRPGLSKKILALEAERLQALLEEWMNLELERDPFTVVETEKGYNIHVGGLTISARLDRVDRLREGGEVVIDYKTGTCSKDYWLPGRPKEPQMLLYALESGFNALAFATLKLKNTRFEVVGDDDEALCSMKGFNSKKNKAWRDKIEGADTWAELNERWKETLTELAREFVRGEACVAPNRALKGNDFPCKFCELSTLCRVFEAEEWHGEEAEEG